MLKKVTRGGREGVRVSAWEGGKKRRMCSERM